MIGLLGRLPPLSSPQRRQLPGRFAQQGLHCDMRVSKNGGGGGPVLGSFYEGSYDLGTCWLSLFLETPTFLESTWKWRRTP